jgi:hypothetical protein
MTRLLVSTAAILLMTTVDQPQPFAPHGLAAAALILIDDDDTSPPAPPAEAPPAPAPTFAPLPSDSTTVPLPPG